MESNILETKQEVNISKLKSLVHQLLPDSQLDKDFQKEPESITLEEYVILAPRWNRMLQALKK